MVYICYGVTIEDGVMISAGTVFTNDAFPRATTPDLSELRSSDPDEETRLTLVARGRHDRRRLHDRQRPADRPLCDGRHGQRRDPRRAGLSPRRRQPGALDRRRLPLRPSRRPVARWPARRSGRRVPEVRRGSIAFAAASSMELDMPATPPSRSRSNGAVTIMTATRQTPSLHWGIVGGGMLGLTLAHRLAERGQQRDRARSGPRSRRPRRAPGSSATSPGTATTT